MRTCRASSLSLLRRQALAPKNHRILRSSSHAAAEFRNKWEKDFGDMRNPQLMVSI
ncbi:hypothetical protein PoMZ_02406 [Pyricularia oryzae]|uniref:Uncharacterized protein n=1 Tax=Pyricularia oryzae TaxID=318829 RepID=A0A4P7N8A4_PYROR|nr:hypothetical protein PoMZ_02406 [Pyricularia oryzae]